MAFGKENQPVIELDPREDVELAEILAYGEAPHHERAKQADTLAEGFESVAVPGVAMKVQARAVNARETAAESPDELQREIAQEGGKMLLTWSNDVLAVADGDPSEGAVRELRGHTGKGYSDYLTRKARGLLLGALHAGEPMSAQEAGDERGSTSFGRGKGIMELQSVRRVSPALGVEILETTTGPRDGEPPQVIWAVRRVRQQQSAQPARPSR